MTLRLYGREERLLGEYPATLIPDACLDPGEDQTGTVDAFLPGSPDATRLELVLNGNVVDTLVPGPPVTAVRDIRLSAPAGRRQAGAEEDADEDPVVTWRAAERRARRRGALAARPADTVYAVQISTDGGRSWQTVGFGLREPRARIDRQVLGDARAVKIRVTASDGFRSVTSEKSLGVRVDR